MADDPKANNSFIVGTPEPQAAPASPAPVNNSPPAANAVKPAPVVGNGAPRPARLALPIAVITGADMGRVARELEAVDNFLSQAAIRQPGTPLVLPRVSRLFEEVVSSNKLNMLQAQDRQILSQFLQQVRSQAPILHVGFCTDPSPIFQQRFIAWIRQQIHPFALLQIGLYPNIGAGCVLRTTNKYFDFSLKQRFNDQRALLIAKLSESDAVPKVASAAGAAGPVPS